MVDVDALLTAARLGEGNRCHTCVWLDTRPPDEAAKWRAALDDTESFNGAQVVRAMGMADPDGAPGEASVKNHRSGHRRSGAKGRP